MKHYIDKDALVAEINRVLNSYDPNEITSGRYALVNLRDFIDTLEVKEVDLEKGSLTWEGIPELLSISEQLKTRWWFRDRTKEIGTQVFWEEVLERFKAQKGE